MAVAARLSPWRKIKGARRIRMETPDPPSAAHRRARLLTQSRARIGGLGNSRSHGVAADLRPVALPIERSPRCGEVRDRGRTLEAHPVPSPHTRGGVLA